MFYTCSGHQLQFSILFHEDSTFLFGRGPRRVRTVFFVYDLRKQDRRRVASLYYLYMTWLMRLLVYYFGVC
jgi:hypothetical protein